MWSQHPFLPTFFKERDVLSVNALTRNMHATLAAKLTSGSCSPGECPHRRMKSKCSTVLPSSVSFLHNFTASTRRAANDPPTWVKMSHSGHSHGRKEDGSALPWDEKGILGLTDGSSLCLTPSISALSAGCHLEGKASQALGKAVKLHPFQSFQYSPGPRRLQLLNWTPTPEVSMWSDTFSERDLSGNAQT